MVDEEKGNVEKRPSKPHNKQPVIKYDDGKLIKEKVERPKPWPPPPSSDKSENEE